MIKIIVVGGPAEQYIDVCLRSIDLQYYKDWEVQVVLDPVGDKTCERAIKWESDKIKIHVNDRQNFALANIIHAINLLKPKDDDILIPIDADDWLYSFFSLEVISRYYAVFHSLLVTHGSWIPYPDPTRITNNGAYTKENFNESIRKVDWRGSHLRTFKYKVWKHVKDEDLRDERGTYFKSAWDLAMVWPMMEMAGFDRVKYIPHTLYVYNQETPFNDDKIHLKEQMYYTNYIARKEQYVYREKL